MLTLQNRSFDHLFGTFPGANGLHAGVPGYSQVDAAGNAVTPTLLTALATPDFPPHPQQLRHHAGRRMAKFAFNNGDLAMQYYDNSVPGIDKVWSYAQQFALADNYFNSALSSAPSDVLYMIAASDNNTAFGVQPFYGPCNKPDPLSTAYTFPNVGDQMNKAKVPWGWFQKNYGLFQWLRGNGESVPILHLHPEHAQSAGHRQLLRAIECHTLPAVSFVQPDPGHNMHPGSGSWQLPGRGWTTSLSK